jgi:two-component system sensor kinase FixL
MPEMRKNNAGLVILSGVLSLAIFIIDILLPAGFSVCMAYLGVCSLYLWVADRRFILYYAILTSVLTALDYFFSPFGGYMEISIFNRIITIAGLWLSVYAIRRYLFMERTRRKNQNQLDALYQAATEAIIVTAENGLITLANPAAHRLFRYEAGALAGMEVDKLVPARYRHKHEDYREHYQHDPRSRAMGSGRDLFAVRRDGTEFPVEISLSYFREEGKLFVISFIIDITQRKEAQNALEKAKLDLEVYANALKESNKELEQFAYVASHDLQEPLRKIQAFGDRLITKEGNNIAPESKDYLDRMLNASVRMKRLINDLLGFSRVTTQAKPFIRIDLNRVASEVLSDIEVAIEKAGAEVEISPLPEILGDPLQMRQLFQNLLSNAIKFRKEGVKPRIRVYSEQPGDKTVMLYFEDNGIGFDERYLDKIFTIFQRLDNQAFEGSGVGLAICKKIALRHGGDITARSIPGEGSTFIVTLNTAMETLKNTHLEAYEK